ncbi:MAG TPA: hypothetical protein VKW04_24700 [Planctomycetota bacterium]|nr:hypothetical protein [Planctomycetota bacterium]
MDALDGIAGSVTVGAAGRTAFLRSGNQARGLLGHHDLDVRWDG